MITVLDTTDKEAPCILVLTKTRTLLHSPPSSIPTKNTYETLTAVGTHEKQGLQGETLPVQCRDKQR